MARRNKVQVVVGGVKRQDSVCNGLKAISKTSNFVAVHDGVRPFITGELIKTVHEAAVKFGAAITAVPVNDTLKRSDKNLFLEDNVERKNLLMLVGMLIYILQNQYYLFVVSLFLIVQPVK